MINSFKQYLVEEEKTVYFTFGRMNPPTIGHGKLLDVLAQKAGRNPYRIYLSQSQDKNKNPLDYSSKVKHVRKMFPKHARQVMINKAVKTVIDALVAMHNDGFNKVVLVVGSDRVRDFDILLNKYNGEKARHGFYNFESIKVVSAGERDPDADGVEGMSASKMRSFAKDNNFTSFGQGLPSTMSNAETRRLFNDVRKGMGLKEEKEFKRHVQLTPVSDLREAYIRDNIFQIGEEVVLNRHDGKLGIIEHLGPNYLIVESKGDRWRCWLNDVSKKDPNNNIAIQDFDVNATPERGVVKESLMEAMQPRWKRVGPNGEIEINHKGQRYKIEKSLDHNLRHKGEFKIMVWDKRSRDWEWDNTVQGKAYAKELVMDKLDEEYKYEWGTDASAKHARKMTPGQSEGAMKRIATTQSNKADRMASTDKKGLETFKKREATTPQDPDIKDRKGTQPKRYHTGLSKAQKIARDRQFKKQSKMADNNPAAYKPAPGDKTAKTRPSKYTKFVQRLMK